MQPGLTELVGQLAGDAREVASAELALVKARALAAVGRYKGAAVLFAAAGTLAFAALIALLVGIILMLLPLVGPVLATLIVVGSVLAIALVLALVGRARLRAPAA